MGLIDTTKLIAFKSAECKKYNAEDKVFLNVEQGAISKANAWSFCQQGIFQVGHSANKAFCQQAIASKSFCQQVIASKSLSTRHFASKAFCQQGILPASHFASKGFCQQGILAFC
jgi:hypothetical protein